MRYSTLVTNTVLLFLTPASIAFPQSPILEMSMDYGESITPNNTKQSRLLYNSLFSYDDVLDLLENIENGNIEQYYSPEEVDRINYFIAFLAKQGILPGEIDQEIALNQSINNLLYSHQNPYAFLCSLNTDYAIVPSVFHGYTDPLLCRSWFKKQWDQTREFVKNHKKAIIIGAAVAIAATVVVVTLITVSAAGATTVCAAQAAGAAVASGGDNKKKPSVTSSESLLAPQSQETSDLKTAIDKQILNFKQDVAKEQFLQPLDSLGCCEGLSLEESGRAIGALLAHESLKNINRKISEQPSLALEIQNISSQFFFPIMETSLYSPVDGHVEIDQTFSTHYAPLYATSTPLSDFNTLSYQLLGEKALESGYYEQAIYDFGKAIELDPTNPLAYLDRGTAYFSLGEYESSIEDYQQFHAQVQKTYPLSIPDFSSGFAKGLPKGIYDSGSGLFLLISDLIRHPLNTGAQMWKALNVLSQLARSADWEALSEAVAPEIHQLVAAWDSIPSNQRGELAGYAFGKYGADILMPGAIVKATSKGLQGAKQLGVIYKGLQTAEKTLILETVAGLESGAEVSGVLRATQTTIALGEEVGLTAQEIAQLKQAGQLETVVDRALENWATKPLTDAYVTALNGGKHAPLISGYSNKTVKEIQKGIKSYQKQIDLHRDKILNPSKHYPDWDTFPPKRQHALIEKKWPAEVECYTEQRDVLQSILDQKK